MVELVTESQTDQKGPSFTYIIDENFFVVRQGVKIIKYDFETMEQVGELELDSYTGLPCHVYQNKFYDVGEKETVVVDLEKMKKEKIITVFKFQEGASKPAFLQFENHLMVLTGNQLYNFIPDVHHQLPVCELPIPVSAQKSILVVDSQTLGVLYDDKFVKVQLMDHLYTQSGKLKFENDRSIMISQTEYYSIGCKSDRFNGKQIVQLFTDDKAKQKVVYEAKNSLENCFFVLSGPYCLVTDQEGQILLLQDDDFEKASEYLSAFKFNTKKELKLAVEGEFVNDRMIRKKTKEELEQERLEKERLEKEKKEAELKALQEEQKRKEEEQKAKQLEEEAQKLLIEKMDKEQKEKYEKEEVERKAKEKLENEEKLAKEKLEKEEKEKQRKLKEEQDKKNREEAEKKRKEDEEKAKKEDEVKKAQYKVKSDEWSQHIKNKITALENKKEAARRVCGPSFTDKIKFFSGQ